MPHLSCASSVLESFVERFYWTFNLAQIFIDFIPKMAKKSGHALTMFEGCECMSEFYFTFRPKIQHFPTENTHTEGSKISKEAKTMSIYSLWSPQDSYRHGALSIFFIFSIFRILANLRCWKLFAKLENPSRPFGDLVESDLGKKIFAIFSLKFFVPCRFFLSFFQSQINFSDFGPAVFWGPLFGKATLTMDLNELSDATSFLCILSSWKFCWAILLNF